MWTINDLPAYGMVSGYSMYGKITCLYCMENNKTFTLTNNGKMSFFFTATSSSCQRITSSERTERTSLLVEKLELIITLPFLPKVNTIKVDMVDEFTWWNYIYIVVSFYCYLLFMRFCRDC
jgi:hypothetical protein